MNIKCVYCKTKEDTRDPDRYIFYLDSGRILHVCSSCSKAPVCACEFGCNDNQFKYSKFCSSECACASKKCCQKCSVS